MKLKYIVQQLTMGEFSQISFGDGPGKIGENSYEAVMAHVNLAMSALYKRFKIKEGKVKIELMEGLFEYALNSKYSINNPANHNEPKYLRDSKYDRFIDNCNKIERIVTDKGYEFPLNDFKEVDSIHLRSLNSFVLPEHYWDLPRKVPSQLITPYVYVTYRAGHTPILDKTLFVEPEVTEVDLPDIYLEALLYFVASRVHNPIGFVSEFHEGNNYAAKYEAECQRLETLGLRMDDSTESSRFARGGWV